MASEIRITLQLLKVLEAMLRAPKDKHWGFELMKTTGLQSGTLYPLLARLETAGWVESDWEPRADAKRPRRRYYRLTGAGVEAARYELANSPGFRTPIGSPIRLRPAIGGIS